MLTVVALELDADLVEVLARLVSEEHLDLELVLRAHEVVLQRRLDSDLHLVRLQEDTLLLQVRELEPAPHGEGRLARLDTREDVRVVGNVGALVALDVQVARVDHREVLGVLDHRAVGCSQTMRGVSEG